MKVQLVVVQGKPEGMVIPLASPSYKIGRGETCQLRPNSDLVSREHAEFSVTPDAVTLQDLGSRNGTEVNGKKLVARQPVVLKAGDLIKVGTLTFAISIEGIPASKASMPTMPGKKPRSLDDVSGDEIDAWLVADESRPTPDRPSEVYGGDTITLATFNGKAKPQATATTMPAATPPRPASPPPPAPKPAPDPAPAPAAQAAPPPPRPAPVAPPPQPEPEPVDEEPETVPEEEEVIDDGIEDLAALQAAESGDSDDSPEEFVDESNPFHVKKKVEPAPGPAPKAASQDSSSIADDILRKLYARKRK